MKEREIAQTLQRVSAEEIPDTLDLWPAIRARVQRQHPRQRPAIAWLAAAAVLIVVVTASLWAAGMDRGPESRVENRPSGSAADWVEPEIFPDLATLSATSDVIVRGQALGADQLQVSQVILNRAGVDPANLKLRLLQVPADAPAMLNDPPLVPGQEYILFLRSYWGLGTEHFRSGDHTLRPVGGSQGQWKIRDGAVQQQAGVPLDALHGMPVDSFIAEIRAAPDPRVAVNALLTQYGWPAGEPNSIRLQAISSAESLARDGDLQRWLAASRRIGLDWAPYAGQQALYLHYTPGPQEVRITVLVMDGQPVGAWVRAGQYGLVFGLDEREGALAAAGDPSLRPTPTRDPEPIGDRVNLAQLFRLATASDAWVKGAPVREGLVRDDALRARLIELLSAELPVERVPAEEVPPDDLQTVLVVFRVGEDTIALRDHLDRNRIYILERNLVFEPPTGWREALAPLLPPAGADGATATPAPAQ